MMGFFLLVMQDCELLIKIIKKSHAFTMPKNCLIHWQLLYTHWCQQAYHRWYMPNKISNLMLVVKLEFSICCPYELIFFQIVKTSIWIARHGQEHRCRHIRIKSLKTNLFLNSLFHPEAYIVFPHVANVWMLQTFVSLLSLMLTKAPYLKIMCIEL